MAKKKSELQPEAEDNQELEQQLEAKDNQESEQQSEAENNQESEQQPEAENNQEVELHPEVEDKQEVEQQPETKKVRRYRIIAPSGATKVIAGLNFINGIAFCEDDFTASWFKNKGYKVSEVST